MNGRQGTVKSTPFDNINKQSRKGTVITPSPKNTGGLLGGAGYILGKAGTGIASIGEGITDLVVGGTLDLIGQDEAAKKIFEDSWVGDWNQALDEWYNPNGVMKVVGDVSGALGQTAGFVGTTAVGTLVGVPQLGLVAIGASGAGNAIGDAVRQTGELGAKEYVYGTASGLTEVMLEKVVGATLSQGAKLAGKAGAKATTKQVGSKLGKAALSNTARKGFIRTTVTEAAEEGIEEFLSTGANTLLLNVTGVDKEAKFSPYEAGYSALIGFVSGGLMSGATQGTRNAMNYSRGQRISTSGNTQTMLNTADYLSKKLHTESGDDRLAPILTQLTNSRTAYEKLKNKDGARASLYLGEMQESVTVLETRAKAYQYADQFAENIKEEPSKAEEYAQKINVLLGTSYTAQDIIDNTDVNGIMGVRDMLGVIRFAGEYMDESMRKAEMESALEAERGEYASEETQDFAADNESSQVTPEMAFAAEAPVFATNDNEAQERGLVSPATQTAEIVDFNAEADKLDAKQAEERKQAITQLKADRNSTNVLIGHALELGIDESEYLVTDGQLSEIGKITNLVSKEIVASQFEGEDGKAHFNRNGRVHPSAAARAISEYKNEIKEKGADAMLVTVMDRAYELDHVTPSDTYNKKHHPERTTKKTDTAKKQTSEEKKKPSEAKGRHAFGEESSGKITEGMTDEERYEILKDATIDDAPTVKELSEFSGKQFNISSWEEINQYRGSEKRSEILNIAEAFEVVGEQYQNSNVSFPFLFSHNDFRESYGKQKRYFESFAKMFSVFDDVIQKAVLVEVHNRADHKPDPTLKKVYVLASAYKDGENVVPIKLEIKEFRDKSASLYVTIALEKIKKTEVSKQGNTENGVTQSSRSVNISISHLFQKINPAEKSFLKYLPDGFLSSEQKAAKEKAIEEDRKRDEEAKQKSRSSLSSEEAQANTAEQTEETETEESEPQAEDPHAEARALAREYLDGFDFYDPETRENVLEWLESANGVENATEATKRAISTIIAARQGLRVVFDDHIQGNGFYFARKDGSDRTVLLINPSQEANVIETTLVHELTHAIEGKPEFKPLAKLADKTVSSEKKKSVAMRYYAHRLRQMGLIDTNAPTAEDIRLALSLLKEQNAQLLASLNEEIRDEIRAHVISETLTSEKHIKLYAELSPGLVAKLWGRMRRMGLAFYSVSGKGAAYRTARKMQKIYENAVLSKGKSQEWMKRVAGGDDEEEKKNTRHHLSVDQIKNYQKRIDAWDGNTEGFSFVMGNTSAAIAHIEIDGKKIGNKQVRIDATKIKKMLADHPEMNIDVVKNLPQLINEPMLILDSKTVPGRLVLLGEVYAENGQPVMMALELNPTTRSGKTSYVDVIKVASAYTRSNTQNLINTSNIRYINENKNRVNDWLKVNRLQLPLPNSQSDSADNSIPDSEEKVNTSSEKNRNSLGNSDPLRYKSTTSELLSEATSYHFGYLPQRVQAELVSELHESQFVLKEDGEMHDKAKELADKVMKAMDENTKHSDNPNLESAHTFVASMKRFIHTVKFTKSEKEDLKHRLDKDGARALLSRWGYQTKKKSDLSFSADKVAQIIAQESSEFSFLEEMHPADAMIALNQYYNDTRKMIDERRIPITDKWSEAEWQHTHAQIEKKVYQALQASARAQAVAYGQEATRKANEHRADVAEEKLERREKGFKLVNEIHKRVEEIKYKKLGRLQNATVYKEKIFRSSIEELGSIMQNGNLSVSKTVNAFRDLNEWYTEDNPLLYKLFAKEVKARIEQIAMNEEGNAFTLTELIAVRDVLANLQKLENEFDRTWRDGKLVEIRPIAERYIEKINRDSTLEFGKVANALLERSAIKWYRGMFSDPGSVMRYADKYEDGFFTETYAEIRRGAIAADVELAMILKEHDEFMKKHRSYLVDAQKKTVNYGGKKDIPLLNAMMLYMTAKREQSWGALMETGWSYWDAKNGKKVNLDSIIKKDTLEAMYAAAEQEASKQAGPTATKDDFAQIFDNLIFEKTKLTMEQEQKKLYSLFSAADKQYIEILERAYLCCGDAKERMDMQRLGFSNRSDGYYVPLYRSDVDVKKLDDEKFLDEVGRLSNARFNKSTVKGAKQALLILPVDYVFRRHARAVTLYANLADVIESYNRIYSFDIGTPIGMDEDGKAVYDKNPNKPKTVNNALESSKYGWNARNDKNKAHVFEWKDGHSYLEDIIDSIQGISGKGKQHVGFLSKLRSAYAVSALGANPKTMATQFTSLVSATSILDMSSILSGVSVNSSDVYKYCKLAELRRDDNHAARAAGVMDKVNRVSDFLMSGIGATDNLVIKMLFGACQAQVAKEGKGTLGSEKNKIEAGKLLERVILETQQNALATERSAAMRSDNEFLRTITMFSSDAMKVFGRAYDAIVEGVVLRERLKTAKTATEKERIKKALAKNKKATAKAVSALALGAVFSAMIAMAFRRLYNKDDEEPVKTVAVDVLGNMVGGLPAIRDAYSFFIEGYDLEDPTYSTLNDLLTASKDLFSMTESIVDGSITTHDVANSAKQTLFSAALILGIPARNAYNVVYGLTKRLKPEWAYQTDSLFKVQSYAADLQKAVEAEDTAMASTIISIALNERLGTSMTTSTREELHRLTMLDYNVLPRTIGESVTVKEGGEKVTHVLTDKERKEIKSAYGKAQKKALTKLIESKAYQEMTDEAKAKSISYAATLCYDMAIRDVTTLESSPGSTAVADVIGADMLASVLAYARSEEADIDEKGKAVTGSRRKKVITAITSLGLSKEQTLLAIYAAGYTPKDGDIKGVKKESAQKSVLSYISSLDASTEAKSALAKMCGFTLDENGKIVK